MCTYWVYIYIPNVYIYRESVCTGCTYKYQTYINRQCVHTGCKYTYQTCIYRECVRTWCIYTYQMCLDVSRERAREYLGSKKIHNVSICLSEEGHRSVKNTCVYMSLRGRAQECVGTRCTDTMCLHIHTIINQPRFRY